MTRLTPVADVPMSDQVRRMYLRTVAGWAADLLRQTPVAQWPQPDPQADYRDRDWRKLYAGNVLDD